MALSDKKVKILIFDGGINRKPTFHEALKRDDCIILTTNEVHNVMAICTAEKVSIALLNISHSRDFNLLIRLKKNPQTNSIAVILFSDEPPSGSDITYGIDNGALDFLIEPLDRQLTIAKIHALLDLIVYQEKIELKYQNLQDYQQDLELKIEDARKGKVIKENFLANMSHEIRTPLNAIVGLTSLLGDTPLDEKQNELLKLMEFSSTSLLEIVDDVLQTFQLESGKIAIKSEPVNVVELVSMIGDSMRILAHSKGLELNVIFRGPNPGIIKSDTLRLKQILINLINNAIKFTCYGKIEVIVETMVEKEARLPISFLVRDSGLGIPEGSIHQIFSRFEKVEDKAWLKYGGTGLGLSIVKQLVELMGGNVEVKSKLGKGTDFKFAATFEIEDNQNWESNHVINRISKTNANLEGIRILLVEDNVINQLVAVRMLEKFGMKVYVASNGSECLEMLRVADFNLILMDTHMPIMNGIVATSKIRTEFNDDKKSIPIISLSASVIEHERKEALLAGVNDFLEKPFDPQTLYAKINRLIIGDVYS